MIKEVLRAISPPFLVNLYKKSTQRYGWFGNYATWEDAIKESTGYETEAIADKVFEAALKVKKGEAAFERDSVTFDRMDYSWPLVSGILWNAALRGGKISVMDFGGSLGSTYFQLSRFLSGLDVRWNIIEQGKFVALGKETLQDNRLRFYLSVQECLVEGSVDVILLSSVLPYVQEPYTVLAQLVALKPSCILVDKMPFLLEGKSDRITLQRVDPAIYPATYPAWFFNESKFLAFMKEDYDLVAEFQDADQANIPSVFKGFIYQRKKAS